MCWAVTCLIPHLGIYWFLWPNSSYSFVNLWYLILRSGSRSSLHSIAFNRRSAVKRDVPSWLGSNFNGSLSTNLPSDCYVASKRNCSSHACRSAVMDCTIGSTSQKRFKSCSRLLTSRSRNVRCVSLGTVTAGVRPENVQPRTVSCSTG
jgi:hypothetical protein